MLGIFGGALRFKYHLDRIGAEGIEGWAYSRSHRKPCFVEFRTTDGELLVSGTTNILRSDLEDRCCGFRLEVDPNKLLALSPGRFLLFVDGEKVANTFFFIPLDQSLIEREMIERYDTLLGLKSERLERENEYLTRKVAELESQVVDL